MSARRFGYALLLLLMLVPAGMMTACANSDYFEPTPLVSPENAMVYLYRPAATNPGKKPLTMSYPEILIDGEGAGFLRYDEYRALELPPGKHTITVRCRTVN